MVDPDPEVAMNKELLPLQGHQMGERPVELGPSVAKSAAANAACYTHGGCLSDEEVVFSGPTPTYQRLHLFHDRHAAIGGRFFKNLIWTEVYYAQLLMPLSLARTARRWYLEREYLEEHNRRFSQTAAWAVDYHRKRPGSRELGDVFRLVRDGASVRQ